MEGLGKKLLNICFPGNEFRRDAAPVHSSRYGKIQYDPTRFSYGIKLITLSAVCADRVCFEYPRKTINI